MPADKPDDLARQVAAAIQTRNWLAAETALRAWIARGDAPAQAPYNLALVLEQCGRLEDAAGYLRRAVEAAPDYGNAWFELGRITLALNDLPAAGAAFAEAIRIMPKDRDTLRLRAQVEDRLGHPADALAAWEAVLTLAPDDGEAATGRLKALLDLGDPRAEAERARLWSIAPLRPAILKALTRTPKGAIPLRLDRLGTEAIVQDRPAL